MRLWVGSEGRAEGEGEGESPVDSKLSEAPPGARLHDPEIMTQPKPRISAQPTRVSRHPLGCFINHC